MRNYIVLIKHQEKRLKCSVDISTKTDKKSMKFKTSLTKRKGGIHLTAVSIANTKHHTYKYVTVLTMSQFHENHSDRKRRINVSYE